MPKNLDKVDIYLLTVDIGADIYMIGGHTLIRVVDHLARTDAVFNWGVFDFNEPNFVLNFLKGTNNYRMEAYSMRDIMAMYTYEKRSIFQQKINLTLTQKAAFMDALIIASQPENIRFRYHFYFINCATKALDVIDAGVNGGLKRFLAAKPGSQTLRDLVRTSLIFYPFTSAAVEIIMNGKTDITQTALDETGFPLNMQAHLNNAPQFDDSGNPLEGTQLLSSADTLVEFTPPGPSPFTG